MSMTQKQQYNVPALRFPEFRGGVKKRSLGDFYEFKSTNSLSRDKLNYERGEVRNIHYGDIHKKFRPAFNLINEQVPFINSDVDLSRISEDKYCKNGDLVIADASEDYADIGKTIELVHLNGEKVLAGLHTLLARLVSDDLAIGFGSYVMACSSVRKQIMLIAQGTKVLGISAGRMTKIILPMPSNEEQQKIVSFLSSVDAKIEQLDKKKILLEQYKKGMMQNLFSKELRFKDVQGNDFPDWEEKILGDVLEIKLREQSKPRENYLAIGVRSHMKGTFQKPDFDPSKIAMEKLFVVRKDDLIVNITFAWEGAIAMVKAEDDGGFVSHRFPTYNCISGKLLPEYIKQVILNKRFKYLLDLISPGGAGRNRVLSKKSFLKLKWSFPDIQEQQKIADSLSSIDQKIALVSTELNHAKTFKKGLLQQMFI